MISFRRGQVAQECTLVRHPFALHVLYQRSRFVSNSLKLKVLGMQLDAR